MAVQIVTLYGSKEGKYWQRIKLWILLAGIADEDYGATRFCIHQHLMPHHTDTGVAASACLSALSTFPEVVERIFEEKQGLSIVKELVARLHASTIASTLNACRAPATHHCNCAASPSCCTS